MGQRGQCLSDLVGFLMGHHIEDTFMFLSPVLLLLESHGEGFLKTVDLKSAWEQGLALDDAGEGQVRWQKSRQMSTAGGNATLMRRVNGSLCGRIRRTPEIGMKEVVWDRGWKGFQLMQEKGEKLPLAVQTYMRMCNSLSKFLNAKDLI